MPTVVLYAYLRRANQDSDPVYPANTTALFQADQIRNALALLRQDLGYPNLGLAVVATDQPSTVQH